MQNRRPLWCCECGKLWQAWAGWCLPVTSSAGARGFCPAPGDRYMRPPQKHSTGRVSLRGVLMTRPKRPLAMRVGVVGGVAVGGRAGGLADGGRPRRGGRANCGGWSRSKWAGLRRSTETWSGLPPMSMRKDLSSLLRTRKGPSYGGRSGPRCASSLVCVVPGVRRAV